MKTFELVFARNASFCLNERPKEFPLFANPGDCIKLENELLLNREA